MVKFYDKDKGIPQYIKIIEEAQAQAERAALPISNDILVAIYKRTMLASNNYPDETNQWKNLAPASCKWDLWKPSYQEVYIANRRKDDIQGEQGKKFGGIASAAETSNAAKKEVNFSNADHTTAITDEMVDSLG